MRKRRSSLASIAALLAGLACATHPGSFRPTPLVTHDDDRHPIAQPKPYWSSLYWDGLDQMVFLPVSRTLSVDVGGPAKNVNAFGEVPDSSWHTNRIGRTSISPERLVRGPCREDDYLSSGPWIARSGKVDGANPGFVIEDSQSHKRYLLKFDSNTQPERATTADVIGSKLYWAFGAGTPCNFIVTFEPATVQLAPDATKTDRFNNEVPLTREDVERAMRTAVRTTDGKLRASASMFVAGTPIGPWTYQGHREDDLNDVVDHEDRRELRGARLMAAWLNHFDSREQNTLSTFMKAGDGELGWVEHWTIDFGDCLGSAWPSDDVSRRLGRSYYFDVGDILTDLITLGLLTRSWERPRADPEAPLFGYFDYETFEPEDWKPGYQNVAFQRMDDADGYWAAQVIARFTDAHIDALVAAARLSRPRYAQRLRTVLIERRNRIVQRYMTRMSAFENPTFSAEQLCFEDVLVTGGYARTDPERYEARIDGGAWAVLSAATTGKPCVAVGPETTTVEARVLSGGTTPATSVTFHLARAGDVPMLIGIARATP